MVEGDPTDGGDLGIGVERGPVRERKDEGTDRDGREHRCAGNDVIEAADELLARGGKTHLLGGLPNRGRDKIGVLRRLPAAGKRHMSRPWITQTLCPADQEQAVRIGRQQNRHGSPDERATRGIYLRLVIGEALPEAEEPGRQCWWLWQDPPQHPPDAGGPRRLKSAGLPAVAGRAVSDIRRSSLRPRHSGQATLVSERTSCSNSVSQAAQRYE
jgi:hypothetical protein